MDKAEALSFRGKKGMKMVQILQKDIIPLEHRKNWLFYGTTSIFKTRINRKGIYQKDASFNAVDACKEAILISEKQGGKPLVFAFENKNDFLIAPVNLFELTVDKIDKFYKRCYECPIYNQEINEPCNLFCVDQQFRNVGERTNKEYSKSYWNPVLSK
jgi:hypothetical protein